MSHEQNTLQRFSDVVLFAIASAVRVQLNVIVRSATLRNVLSPEKRAYQQLNSTDRTDH